MSNDPLYASTQDQKDATDVKNHRARGETRHLILEHLAATSKPVSTPEIGNLVGGSKSVINWHMQSLLTAGLVRRARKGGMGRGNAATWTLTAKGKKELGIETKAKTVTKTPVEETYTGVLVEGTPLALDNSVVLGDTHGDSFVQSPVTPHYESTFTLREFPVLDLGQVDFLPGGRVQITMPRQSFFSLIETVQG